MKKTNKLISILLVMAMLLSMAPLSLTASAADIEVYATGTLGSGSRTAWTIYDNGLLVIDGKGNSVSTKWDSTTASPWKDYADIITRASFVNCENWECIPECTFRSLSKLKDVTLPENIEEICQYAFTGTAIETILLPDGLITIGYYAFSSCESLKYININDGVTSIGSSAFYNCSSLKAISIPDSVTSIGQTLFQNCTNLEYVRLSENADKVGGSMFSGCTMLKNVSLPASVTVIGSKAFSNASNLEGVYYHGVNEPTTYNPGINNATFSLAPDTMVIYASNDYSATTMGLKANWENDVQNVTKIEGHFVNIAHTANGAVKVGASIVPAGDTVTIDIMAYKNYELDTITVTDSNGQVELSGSGHSRTFSMPEGDVRISATFKSTATPHVHSWTYAANGATITATCAYADTCHNPISKVEISKGNTSSLTFRPDNAKYMTVSGTMEDVVIPDLVYTLKSTGEPTTPINPGVYVASLTIENVTATYEFEITRGNFNYTYFTYTAPQNLTYDGTPKHASVVMSEDYVPYAGEYTVYYNSGTTEPINAGTYTVKVNVAESDYFTAGTALSGRAWRFTIAPKSIEDLTYEGLGTSYPVGATPDVTIKHGDMVLVKDTDYTVEYANNTELGTATMTVTGVGNYTGSKTLEFEIVPHTHSFTYFASGDTITAVCENTDGNCPDSEGTLTIYAPADLYVDGITAKEATIENNLVDTSVAISDITYSAPYGLPPKDAGTYTASVTIGGATATVEFTLLNYAAMVTDKDGNELSGSPYKTFADAVTAAEGSEGSTVTLLDDVTLTAEQVIRSGKLTLDLNGKNLINENGRVLYIYEEADLTIKDSGENGTIEIKYEYMYCIVNYGKLTVESGIIKGDGGIDNEGVLYFNDGTVETDYYSAIINYSGGTVYIYDGVLKSSNSGAIQNIGTLYVYGGEIDGIYNEGTAYISGGKIDRDNHAALNLLGGTVEVTGGSFTGTDNEYGHYSGTPYGEWTVRCTEGATLTIKGGEFPNGFVIDEKTANTLLAEGYYYKDADSKLIDVADDAKIINGYVKVSKGADLADAVITLDSTEFTYNGGEIKPTVIVTVGGKTLTEGKDYTLTFANNVNAGTATVTIKAVSQAAGGIAGGGEDIGNSSNSGDITESIYTGEVTKEFTINKKAVTVTATAPDKVYDGTTDIEISEIVISFNGIVEGDTVGYTIKDAWYNGIVVGTDWFVPIVYNVTGEDANNYMFPEGGEYIAPDYFVKATADITAKDISDGFIILGDPLTYNGKEQTQTVEKVIPTGTAPEATFTVSGNKATNVGVYLLTVTGTGNFTGEAKIAYEIAVDKSGIEGLTIENVKSTNKENVEYVYNQLENAVKDLADEDKISEWNTLQSYCAAMRQRIEIVENQIKAFENKLSEYDIDTVTSDDTADLESFQNSVGKFYNDYYDNLTDEQIKKVTDIYGAIEDLETRISDVAEEITRITNAVNGYDEATVKYDDYKDILQLIDDIEALTTGKNITDFERADLEELNAKANLLAAKIRSTADEISRITRAVNAYNIDTVKSSDKADIENLISRIKKLTDGDNITADERANLNELDSTLDALLAKIDETADEITRLEAEVGKYDEATVKSSDKTDIEQLKADIKALADGQNITADERAKLENLDATADALLAKIAETKSEYDRLIAAANGYDEATVTSADKDALVQLNEDIYALALTDNVTAEELENLENSHDKVLGLIDKLTDISDEIKRIIEAVDKYVFESVKSSDKTDIEQLIADIKALLDTQNITADERALLEGADETCTKLIEKIDETVAEINRINDATNAYDEATVTSADKADIEKLLADIKALTDGDNITDAEREQLNGNEATLNALLDKIGATADEIARIETAVNGYGEESVKSSDKADLEQLIEDIKALTDATNITEDERTKLGELDAKIDALIKKIDDTAAEIERIDEAVNGYDKDTVTSDDVPELGKLIDDIKALTDGDNLTEDEKGALEETKKAIDNLIEKLEEVAEEIKRVDEAVKSYDEETVKSTDSEDLAQLKEDIQNLIDSDNTTENEKTVLKDMIADIEGLEDKITETEEKLEEIKGIENNYNPETVSSDDKAAIEDKIAEIEAVNPDNLTDEQKAEYEEIKAGFEALLEEIAAAEKNVADIGVELEMFDEERVTKFWEDDIEALKAKIDELLADKNMGETEKAKLEEYKAECDNLIEIINTPNAYFSMRLFYFVWDALNWLSSHVVFIFNWIF